VLDAQRTLSTPSSTKPHHRQQHGLARQAVQGAGRGLAERARDAREPGAAAGEPAAEGLISGSDVRVHVFETVIGLLLVAVSLAALARRIGAPYPALLALGGAVLAFVPGGPVFSIPPDLALALFVAPVLLDAAYDASPRDLKESWAAVAGLVVVSVALTTIAVAAVARAMVPSMPWAAAVAPAPSSSSTRRRPPPSCARCGSRIASSRS
jgi:hypothetical protein